MNVTINTLIGNLIVVGNDVDSNEIEEKVLKALNKAIASASIDITEPSEETKE